MQQVGHDWETDRIDVWQEHRGTQICATAVYDLLAEVAPRVESQRPIALGGGPEGDPYHLASLLAQVALVDARWEAVNLGPNTPFQSFTNALRELRPRLVWISVSYVVDADKFVREYRPFQQEASRRGVAIALGGCALVEPLRSQLGLYHLRRWIDALVGVRPHLASSSQTSSSWPPSARVNNFECVRVEERAAAPVFFAGNSIIIPPRRLAEISSSQPRHLRCKMCCISGLSHITQLLSPHRLGLRDREPGRRICGRG